MTLTAAYIAAEGLLHNIMAGTGQPKLLSMFNKKTN